MEVTLESNARSNGAFDTEIGRMPTRKEASASQHSKELEGMPKHNQRPFITAKDGMGGRRSRLNVA